MSKILVTDLKQNFNRLDMQLKPSIRDDERCTEITDNIALCGLLKFQIRNISNHQKRNYGDITSQTISIKFSKIYQTDHLIYYVKLSSYHLKIRSQEFFVIDDNIDNACWQIFYDNDKQFNRIFSLELTLDISRSINCIFNSLHEDTELTDFELRGTDGSIKVHKAILAGYSPVMKTMLAGEWKETASGFVEVKASKKTLMQLKDYMYLHTLPKSDIKELIEIASLYMMPDLEECCTAKLLTSITAENAAELLEYAVKFNMERLKFGILGCVQSGLIKVEDMIRKSDAGQAAESDCVRRWLFEKKHEKSH